jgi:hypothetical protein
MLNPTCKFEGHGVTVHGVREKTGLGRANIPEFLPLFAAPCLLTLIADLSASPLQGPCTRVVLTVTLRWALRRLDDIEHLVVHDNSPLLARV